jgi:hypothetical protein
VYVCHSKGGGARQNTEVPSEWGMVVGARCTGLSVSRAAMLQCIKDGPPPKETSSQLDTTVGSIGVNMGQHPYGTLSTPCRVHTLTN